MDPMLRIRKLAHLKYVSMLELFFLAVFVDGQVKPEKFRLGHPTTDELSAIINMIFSRAPRDPLGFSVNIVVWKQYFCGKQRKQRKQRKQKILLVLLGLRVLRILLREEIHEVNGKQKKQILYYCLQTTILSGDKK